MKILVIETQRGEELYAGDMDSVILELSFVETPELIKRTREYDLYKAKLTKAGEFIHYYGNP